MKRLSVNVDTCNKLITEYKKFLQMCKVCTVQPIPSEQIDAVWRIHQQNNEEYYFQMKALFPEGLKYNPIDPSNQNAPEKIDDTDKKTLVK